MKTRHVRQRKGGQGSKRRLRTRGLKERDAKERENKEEKKPDNK